MNQVMGQLFERKSVRVFEDKPVAEEVKVQLLEAAYQAPTAGNMMLYTILEITNQPLKEALAESCDHQPFIAKAPLVLVFLADYQRWYDTFTHEGLNPRKPGAGDLMLACADAAIAAQNSVVAAQSLGLGSCYIGDIIENCEQVRELLHLPDYVFPAAMVVYGYATEQQQARPKPPRFEDKYIRFENHYRRLTPEEHKDMHGKHNQDKGQPDRDIHQDLDAFHQRKYASDFAREMNRSTNVYWKAFFEKE